MILDPTAVDRSAGATRSRRRRSPRLPVRVRLSGWRAYKQAIEHYGKDPDRYDEGRDCGDGVGVGRLRATPEAAFGERSHAARER